MGTQFPDFWLAQSPAPTVAHVALRADDRAAVDAFHAAALAAGGRDNGAPGLRPQYHPGYYGAFVFDPDGNNVEAVHHTFGCTEADVLRTTAGPWSRRLRAIRPASSVDGARLRTGGASRVASHPLFDLVGDAYASRPALSTALNATRRDAESTDPRGESTITVRLAQTFRCGYSASTTARYCA